MDKIFNKIIKADLKYNKIIFLYKSIYNYGLYNDYMENYIIFILSSIIIDYLFCYNLKTIFKLKIKNLSILFLQFLNVCNVSICIFFEMSFCYFIITKIFVTILICLLITDDYKLKKLISLCFASIVLMFSYYGFFCFMIELFKAVANDVFDKKLSFIWNLIIIIVLILYIFAVLLLTKSLYNRKNLNHFLRKVSFYAFGKHIEIVGLLDSGNTLIDDQSKKPVIVLSLYALKKILPKVSYDAVLKKDFSSLGVSHNLKIKFASGEVSQIPIIDIKSVNIVEDSKLKTFDCVIGLVDHKFENDETYQCLLHRNFV